MKRIKLGNVLCGILEFLGKVVISILEALEDDYE